MKTQQAAASAFILRKDGRFLLVQRSLSEKFMPESWEMPGGGCEYGETPEQALVRETKEEAGLDIKVQSPLTVGSYFMDDVQRIDIVFLCAMIDESQEVKLSHEHIGLAWVSFEQAKKLGFSDYMRNLIETVRNDRDFA